MPTVEDVREKIFKVKDPEIGLGVIDLGLVYDVHLKEDGQVEITMTLTTPACPYGPELIDQVKQAAESVEGVRAANVLVVWDPPWDPEEMASEYAKDVLGIW